MDAHTTRRTVADNVRAHMQSAGTTRDALAEQTGMPRTTLYRCLTGIRDFTVTELVAVGDALDVNVSDLLGAVILDSAS